MVGRMTRHTVPVCPCTIRAMKAAEAASDSWNAAALRRENAALIDAFEHHGYGYVTPAARVKMVAAGMQP